MSENKIYPEGKLFTPGPVQVTMTVRNKLSQYNLGSREPFFVDTCERVTKNLLKVAQLDAGEYSAILMQGSGTFGVESVLQTVIPPENHPDGKDIRALIVTNGSFGERVALIAKGLNIVYREVKFLETMAIDPVEVEKIALEYKPTHIMMVHSETTVGIINDVAECTIII